MSLDYRMQLSGRLEKVNIKLPYSNECALGDLNGTSVIVTNGSDYSEKDVLVKFDIINNQKKISPEMRDKIIGNFITSNVPSDFKGLAPEEYVLCGLLKDRGHNKRYFPQLTEINDYFNPGNIRNIIYLKEHSTFHKGKAFLTRNGFFPQKGSISYLIRKKLPDPKEAARVVIAESESDLERVIQEIKKLGLKAIEMEPLR